MGSPYGRLTTRTLREAHAALQVRMDTLQAMAERDHPQAATVHAAITQMYDRAERAAAEIGGELHSRQAAERMRNGTRRVRRGR